jgi:hypothetical protein
MADTPMTLSQQTLAERTVGERAKTCGYPERFAQEALGHNSIAVHRAYAKKAKVKLPSLEEYERKIVPLPNMNYRENPVRSPIKEVV